MKSKFLILTAILGLTICQAKAQLISVTETDALEIAKRQFVGRDVDYSWRAVLRAVIIAQAEKEAHVEWSYRQM